MKNNVVKGLGCIAVLLVLAIASILDVILIIPTFLWNIGVVIYGWIKIKDLRMAIEAVTEVFLEKTKQNFQRLIEGLDYFMEEIEL